MRCQIGPSDELGNCMPEKVIGIGSGARAVVTRLSFRSLTPIAKFQVCTMSELKLPPDDFMGCKGFKLPGKNAMRDMQATFDVQRSEMDQHKNARTGELAKGDTGTGDTPCFEVHFDDDAQSAVIFAYAELIANVFDVPVTAGLLDDVDITFLVGATGAITITRGDGEGLAGFAPTGGGITLWNMSTPFSPAALVRGGKTRPKLLTKKGTGGFNYGLKQLVKNCLGDEIQPEFQFVGYVKDTAEGEAADDARPPAGSSKANKLPG